MRNVGIALCLAVTLFGCRKAPKESVVLSSAKAEATPAVSVRESERPPADLLTPPAGAHRTQDGILSQVLTPGTGKVQPTKDDVVRVRYKGWNRGGRMFTSSGDQGPVLLPVNDVVAGWGETIKLMVEGETRRAWIPAALASGVSQRMEPGDLVMEFSLVEILSPPKVPDDLAQPPKNAKSTPRGVIYRVLQKSKDTRRPSESDTVKLHYSGWTFDGKLYDSSIQRRVPATMPVGKTVAGWKEALLQMAPGEKRRLWIPPALGYPLEANRPNTPSGPIVVDLELVDIVPSAKPSEAPEPAATAG